MSLEKIIVVLIVVRLIDILILFFSRKVTKKRRVLIRGGLLMATTVLAIGVVIGLPSLGKEAQSQGLSTVVKELTKDGQRLVSEQVKVVEVSKRPFLEGKKVAVIGDSITELDGKTVPNVGKVIGYQEAFRQQGATVVNYGYSGATYAKIVGSQNASIYDKIVTDKVDFKSIDVVTLFGGTNDVGRGHPLGKATETNTATLLGGLRGIIDYIKQNNPTCQIFIFTPIERSDKPTIQANMEAAVSGIMAVAKNYDLPADDLWRNSGITQKNQEQYLYDKLHPNSEGMALIGQRMVEVIEAADE